MRTWRRTLLRSSLIASGLMLGHAAWVAVGVAHSERAMAQHLAYFRSDAEVGLSVGHGGGFLASQATSLWSSATTVRAEVAWSPVLLVIQFVIATLATFAVWSTALWVVRLIVCRGAAGLGTSLDLRTSERSAPGRAVVAVSPIFAFIAALGFGMAVTLAARYAPATPPPGGLASPIEHIGWTVPLTFAVACAAAWGLRTTRTARARQTAAHQAKESCSRCGYEYGGIPADPCPECGTVPPPSRGRTRSWPTVLTAMLLPLIALLTGLVATGTVPGLIAFAFDRNVTIVDSGFAVDVPLGRPILVEGDWGRVYLVAAPVGTGETLVRAVLMDESQDQAAHVATTVIGAATPLGGLRAWLDIPSIPALSNEGLMASVYNLSFGDPDSRFVVVDRFAAAPRRIRALPRGADLPSDVKQVLDGVSLDNSASSRLVEPSKPRRP